MSDLRSFPAGLTALYKRMIYYIDDSEDKDLLYEVLTVASVVYRPISIPEMATSLDIPEEIAHDEKALNELISSCGSFLTIRNNIVYFIHQSAKDFLLDTSTSIISSRDIKKRHHSIFSRSIKALSRNLRQDIDDLRKRGAFVAESNPLPFDSLAPLRYSCSFWVAHFIDGNMSEQPHAKDQQAADIIKQFLESNYISWLEVLGLLGDMSATITSLSRLLTCIRVSFLPFSSPRVASNGSRTTKKR
jgi:hypothetical protein